MLTLHRRVLLVASLARVQPEGVALALVLWCAARGRPGLAGILIAATTLPQLVTGPVMGRALDRSPRPVTVTALGATASAVACVVLAAADLRPAPSIAAAFVLSFSTPVLTGGLSSLIMGWSDDHTSLAAWDSAGYNVAGLAAPILVTATAAWDPPLALAALAVSSLALAVLFAARSPRPSRSIPRHARGGEPRARIRDAIVALVTPRPLRAVTVATTVLSAGLGGLELGLASALAVRGLPAERVGVLATVIAVGALAGSLALTRRHLTITPTRMTLVAVGASSSIVFAMAASPWWAMIVLAAALGLADAPLLVGTYRTRTEHSAASTRAGVFTVAASAKLGAGALGALVMAAVTSGGPTNVGLGLVGVTGLAGAVIGAAQLDRPS